MKKIVVAMYILFLSGALFSKTSPIMVLKNVPDEYLGEYYVHGIASGKSYYPKNGIYIGVMLSNSLIYLDGEIKTISSVTIEVVDNQRILEVKFSDNNECYRIAKIVGKNYYMMFVFHPQLKDYNRALVIKIKKNILVKN